jgi:hypothetical protein
VLIERAAHVAADEVVEVVVDERQRRRPAERLGDAAAASVALRIAEATTRGRSVTIFAIGTS